jgi:threonylcarbamoyladenosine tRNA methylthiotransferase MtaB
MPQQPRSTIRDRAARLRKKGDAALGARLDGMKGSRHMVLAERGGIGRTPCFTPVEIGDVAYGTFLTVAITGRRGEHLTGTAV